jgi:hypothetical protein
MVSKQVYRIKEKMGRSISIHRVKEGEYMFWIGLEIGLVVGSSTGILLYAIRTSNEIKEDLKESNNEKI